MQNVIKILGEDLLTPSRAARHPLLMKDDRPAHISFVYRKIQSGDLEAARTARGIVTSVQAIERMVMRLNGIGEAEISAYVTPAKQQKRHAHAEAELEAAGI